MDKIPETTPNLAAENAAKLLKLFPECAGECGEVDLEKLKQVLADHALDGDVERYQFTWPGKHAAMAEANVPTTKTLAIDPPYNTGKVMQLNAEDGGKRKFIMVQLPEVCAEGSEAAKAGWKNICQIGKERIRRAGKKIVEEGRRKDEEVRRICFRLAARSVIAPYRR